MKTILKTAPLVMPISLEEAKKHCNIVLGFTDDDAYLETLIAAAVEEVESLMVRRIISQTWYYYLDEWPSEEYISIPYGKLQSAVAPVVTYTDTDESAETLTAATYYLVDTNSEPGRLILRYGMSWPTVTLSPMNPIKIEFVCGYGLTGSTVPPTIIQAIKYLVADTYENRETMVVGQGFTVVQVDLVEKLLWPHKVHGVF